MTDPLTRKKKEICQKGKLAGYESIISILIDQIDASDCKISCCDTCETSSIVQYWDSSERDHIKIGFLYPRERPIHYIWEILHEFGHHLSGKPVKGEEKTVAREELAWEHALIELKKHDGLVEELNDFMSYKENV